MRTVNQLLINFLLNATWQIAFVTLCATGCHWLLRNLAATSRHAVWVAAILISFLLPVASSLNAEGLRSDPKPADTSAAAVIPRTSDFAEADTPAPVMLSEIQPAPVEVVKRAPFQLSQTVALSILAFYFLFAGYRAIVLLRAWRKTNGIIAAARSGEVSATALEVIARCQTALRVSRVRIVSSPTVRVPVTAGIFQPLIILPESLLSSADKELLTTAIGHELVHVARRDYLLNLAYEIIYLPMAFHPAAGLLRRRIKQTRELCCDELVAKKLLGAERYARSLVRLIGDVSLAPRLAADITIGISDADILEVRIMSLLKNSKLTPRRNALLVVAAGLVLALPCAAALGFAVKFDIAPSQAAASDVQKETEAGRQKIERAREELQRQEKELSERSRKVSGATAADVEALRRMEADIRDASEKLSNEKNAQHLGEMRMKLAQMQQRYAELVTKYPDTGALRQAQQQVEELRRSWPDGERLAKELQAQLALVEKEYPKGAISAEQLKEMAHAQEDFARAQEELKAQQRKTEAEREAQEQESEHLQEKYERAIEDREAAEQDLKALNKEYNEAIHKGLDKEIRKEMSGAVHSARAKEHAEVSRLATVPMDRAIQIANSRQPGRVISATLRRQKGGQLYYRLVIISGEGEKSSVSQVWVSATDGSILKVEHE